MTARPIFHPGQIVRCVAPGTNPKLKEGNLYTVDEFNPGNGKAEVRIDGTIYYAFRFEAVDATTNAATTPAERMADKLMALNNARPRLPTRDEIIAVLREPLDG